MARPIPLPEVYDATMMGFTCVFLLGRAGEPVRPVLIARKDSLSVAGMFGVYVLERVADIAAAVVVAILALFLFQRGHWPAVAVASSTCRSCRSPDPQQRRYSPASSA